MPIYEYTCEKCGKTIELIHKVSARPPKQHETCGGKLQRAISRTAFQLKGGGWYADGYGASSSSSSKSTEKSSEPSASSESKKSTPST